MSDTPLAEPDMNFSTIRHSLESFTFGEQGCHKVDESYVAWGTVSATMAKKKMEAPIHYHQVPSP